MKTTRLSGTVVIVALALGACGGGSDQADDAAESASERGDQSVAGSSAPVDEPAEPDSEPASEPADEPASEPAAASEAAPAGDGVSRAVLVLDGVEYVFDEIRQCLKFGDLPVMSLIATNAAGEKLDISYEEFGAFDDEDAQYVNMIKFEPADGNSSWRAGTVIGLTPSEYGALDWALSERTISGSGDFENVFDQASGLVAGTITATCAE